MDDGIAIRVEHVHKTFKLPHEKHSSIKSALIDVLRGKGGLKYERQQVLNDVSFEVKEGEFFGILGRNGSGKSTLLKLLAGIYVPDSGSLEVHGSLTPFIELGVGFNPELTGRENVFLNGALLGFEHKEMDAMYEDIVKFAELEKFMDQKLKNYSSGMQVRLAFSIAVRAKTAILLIDEVLAVGDIKFQQKCFEYFYKLKREKRTIVFISHDMESVQKFCDRAVVIDSGKLIFEGKPAAAAVLYKKLNFPETKLELAKAVGEKELQVHFTNKAGKSQKVFETNDAITVNLKWRPNRRAQFIGVALHRDDGLYIFGTNNVSNKRFLKEDQGTASYSFDLNVGAGNYYVEVAIFGADESDKVYYIPQGPSFIVHNPNNWQGITELSHSWHTS